MNTGRPEEGTPTDRLNNWFNTIQERFSSVAPDQRDWTTRAAIDSHNRPVMVAGVVHREDQATPQMPPALYSIFGNDPHVQIQTLPLEDQPEV